MKRSEIFFAFICGALIGLVASEFLTGLNISFGVEQLVFFLLAFALFSVACLWLSFVIGRRFLVIFQAAKHLLIGAFATIIDLKLFEFLIIGLAPAIGPMAIKGASFAFAATIKYWGNKHWAFNKSENENLSLEIGNFILITLIGLIIDVLAFYYLTNILVSGNVLTPIWVKLSVILAALVAAIWNFLGYKFLVFKK